MSTRAGLCLLLGACISFQRTAQHEALLLAPCQQDDPTCYGPQPPPQLGFAPAMLDFGDVGVGAPVQAEVILQNVGRRTLQPFTITPLNGPFVIAANSCTAENLHESCTVVVSFEPLVPGSYTGSLSARVGDELTVSLPLTGVGRDYVNLAVAVLGDGVGAVTQVGGPLDCPSNCTVAVPRTGANVSVDLQISYDAVSTLPPVVTGCDTLAGDLCSLTLTGDRSVSVTVTRRTYVVNVRKVGLSVPSGMQGQGEVALGSELCEPLCTAGIKHGYPVVIHATATPPSSGLAGYSGSVCSGATGDCRFEVTGATDVDVQLAPYNVAFVSSQTFGVGAGSGQFSTLAGADAACNQMAQAANSLLLAGRTWRALLATDATSIQARLGQARGWLLPDVTPLTDTFFESDSTQLYQRLNVTEQITTPASAFNVFTGADGAGASSVGNTCGNWQSNAGSGMAGVLYRGNPRWLSGPTVSCAGPARLYCASVDFTVPLRPAPVGPPSRRIFLSDTPIGGNAGIGGFDALCRSNAVSAGVCGSTDPIACPFKALVATTTQSAADRFASSNTSASIVRIDGALVAEDQAHLFAGDVLAGIDWHASGGAATSTTAAWTGAPSSDPFGALGGTSDTCTDWSGSGVGVQGAVWEIGQEGSNDTGFFTGSAMTCSFSGYVYCLEE